MLQAPTVRERLLSTLGLFFAAISLPLVAIGLYGVLDYSVFKQRREIGIRLAIGAQAREIVWRVTFEFVAWVAFGSLAGFAVAMGVSRYIESLLYQVQATNLSAAIPMLILCMVLVLASLAPVIRAVRTDVAVVLRSE